MIDNLYQLEQMNIEYRQRRLVEADLQRRLKAARPAAPTGRPVWCPLALVLASGLIALGKRLQAAAELRPQPANETC